MKRREFVKLVGGAAVAWPPAARAQQPGRNYRLGVFLPFGRDQVGFSALFDELRVNGYVEGQNLTILEGSHDVYDSELAARATAIVNAAPDVIHSGPDPYTRAIQKVAGTIPVVALSGNLVAAGLVSSLAHPAGNTTGVSMFAPELDGKRQDILIEATPGVRRIAALADSTMSQTAPGHFEELKKSADQHGIELITFSIAKPEEIAPAINAAKESGAEALNFLATPLFLVQRRVIFEQVAAVRLPAIYQWPEMAEQGGLVAYGPSLGQIYRQVARLVIKVLRGTNPGDIPAEQPTNFELVINLKTAKALGFSVPPSLLTRADEVIE